MDNLINEKQHHPLMYSFSSEDLLEYIFEESSPEKSAAIKEALENDWNLREEFNLLSNTYEHLEKISFSPSKKTIDYILNYAKTSKHEVSETA